MTQIHVLPPTFDPADGLKALLALQRAVESGVDLGSRSQHIHALGLSLESMLELLRQATAAVPASPGPLADEWQGVQVSVDHLIRTLGCLTARCRAIPV